MNFEWNGETEAMLRRLWGEGLSMTAIAGRLGTSKNAVAGKVNRSDLPGRPSPIRPLAEGAVRSRAPERPKLPGTVLRRDGGAMQGSSLAALGVALAPRPVVHVLAPAAVPVAPAVAYRPASRACCWPLWSHDARADGRFCGAAGEPGKPYCAAHCAKAYTRPEPLMVAG